MVSKNSMVESRIVWQVSFYYRLVELAMRNVSDGGYRKMQFWRTCISIKKNEVKILLSNEKIAF